jgi:hypothetical protein
LVPDLSSAEFLHLVWHPAHFQAGQLKSSAFSSSDLGGDADRNGVGRYASVDEVSLLSKPSVDWRIAHQQRDGMDEKEGRKEARFIRFQTPELTSATDGDGGACIFEITPEPTIEGEAGPESPANPAHCGLRNARITHYRSLSRGKKKIYIEMLRVKLLKLHTGILHYDAVFNE